MAAMPTRITPPTLWIRLLRRARIAVWFSKTVAKFASVKGSGMARPSSARALNGAKKNQISGSAKTAPSSAASAEKPTRERIAECEGHASAPVGRLRAMRR